MARCRNCGNTTNFNVWCVIRKILEVEIDDDNALLGVVGESEDAAAGAESGDVGFADNDLRFAMVGCAWCGSDDVECEKGVAEKHVREQ